MWEAKYEEHKPLLGSPFRYNGNKVAVIIQTPKKFQNTFVYNLPVK
jgi:hypothetical protein